MSLLALVTLWIVVAAPVDLSGVWDLEMVFTSSGATSTGVCNFNQQDDKLTGSCGTEDVPITGEVNGDKVSWRFEAQQGERKHTMVFMGVVEQEGPRVKGTCRVVGGPEGTFTATKRAKGR
jgi:hypothetical protein